ncbi:MAG: sulfotransferase [Nocardioides sp.]
MNTEPFSVDPVIAKARAKEGLDDFGPGEFEEPLGVLLDAYGGAGLSDLGAMILGSGAVHSLRMRLRATEWIRRFPEIADEVVDDPIVVVGMMRSGTTLTQRLLAADPHFRCAQGWEVIEVAPSLDHDWSSADPRIARGLEREEQTKTFAPDLFAIHPMHALEAEEEIVFLADAFLSHVPESGAHVPGYREWLDAQSFTPAYDYLHRMLQLLQWQKRQRGETAERWVLKTPAHLGYLDDLHARFPGVHVVHLHRDPRETIPSGASLNTVLHQMHSDQVDPVRVGTDWIERMGWTNDRALATRARWDAESAQVKADSASSGAPRVTDIAFADVVADPIAQVARVYDDAGLELTAEAEASMRSWLQRRPREAGRPAYDAVSFGLTDTAIDDRFRAYNERFRQY